MGIQHLGAERVLSDATVIVATKGRPAEVAALLARLERQTLLPRRVLIVGASSADFEPAAIASVRSYECHGWVSKRLGTTAQRNEGIDFLRDADLLQEDALTVFFDDDFRPADTWLAECAAVLHKDREIQAVTGLVLADGAHASALSDEDADRFLEGVIDARPHWASGRQRDIGSLYGCNMAFRASVLLPCRFDEELPLYGWQEDRDITGQVRAFGRVTFEPTCRGVHLGSSGGRASGLRFGYAQVANVIYLWRKGTVEAHVLVKFLARAVASNLLKTVKGKRKPIYFQRLKGNALAVADLVRGTCRPRRIIDLP